MENVEDPVPENESTWLAPPFTDVTTSALGTAAAQWLRFCATNRKVAGSIPDGVVGFFR
jgi:hypothetical protein